MFSRQYVDAQLYFTCLMLHVCSLTVSSVGRPDVWVLISFFGWFCSFYTEKCAVRAASSHKRCRRTDKQHAGTVSITCMSIEPVKSLQDNIDR